MGTRAKNIFKGLFNLSFSVLWQYLLFLWAIYVFLFIFRRKLTKIQRVQLFWSNCCDMVWNFSQLKKFRSQFEYSPMFRFWEWTQGKGNFDKMFVKISFRHLHGPVIPCCVTRHSILEFYLEEWSLPFVSYFSFQSPQIVTPFRDKSTISCRILSTALAITRL